MKRADVLLLLIEERCSPGPSGHYRDGVYWVPRADPEYVKFQKETVWVYGAGDMSALKSLERKGLIEVVTMNGTRVGWRITEDGVLRAHTLA